MSNNVSPPQLRPYQRETVSRAIEHFRSSDDPAVVVLPTGAGKSLVIAELARLARGRVLVLAHVRELVEQNHAKYLAYGRDADIFSAGLGRKESARQVVFASVQSVINGLEAFSQGDFTLLVIDECHRVDIHASGNNARSKGNRKSLPGYQRVIETLRKANPSLKILGLTATPYRLGQGFIYYRHYHGMVRGSEDAFFRDCVYELPLRWMVRHGYLCEPKRIDAAVEGYDFSHLLIGSSGYFPEQEIARVAESNRATPGIIAEVIERSHDRHGVMIFAGSVDHAREIYALLPDGEAALVTGDTASDQRSRIIDDFKRKRLKYLVNVSVLTTGFDAPHVDVIAILRPTESIGLYQQIVGRGLRLSEGKTDCLILDYAGNPWSLYAPEVGQPRPATDTEPVQVECPQCGFANLFWGRRDGDIIIEHFGRRCQGLVEDGQGVRQQCDFRFRFKNCPQCNGENDIAARRCGHCGEVLVDIDRKLKEILKLRDAKVLKVAAMRLSSRHNGRGLERLKVDYLDEEGESLGAWYAFDTPAQRQAFYHAFLHEHCKAPGIAWQPASINEVLAGVNRLRAPDFVIARKVGRYWQINSRVFDYQAMGGRYQLAECAAAARVYADN